MGILTNEEKIMRYDEIVDFLKIFDPSEKVMASFLLRKLQETEEERNEEAKKIFEANR